MNFFLFQIVHSGVGLLHIFSNGGTHKTRQCRNNLPFPLFSTGLLFDN